MKRSRSMGKMRKARRGRKRSPAPHRPHRKKGALRDPVTRAHKRVRLEREREQYERAEVDELREWGFA